MIKAVIFDMDGVIIDSEMEYLKFVLQFVRQKNPDIELDDLFGMVGFSPKDSWSHVKKAVNNGQTWEELRHEYITQLNPFSKIDYQKIYRPQVTNLLKGLKGLGLKTALASSTQKEVIFDVLDKNNIRGFFDVVVSGQKFKRSKPDPEIYHYTANALNVNESECFVIEDSTVGITAASCAGMKIAAIIDERFQFDQSLADYRVSKINDLFPIIKSELIQ